MNVRARIIRATHDEISKPESYVKGDEFQCFVRSHIFSKDHYDLLQKTHDYTSNKNDYVESSKEPDFKFRSRKSGREFFVEAKYRSKFYKGAVEWCKPYQFSRYQDIDKKTPIFVVIGVGQPPESPEHVFLAPLKHIRYNRLFPSFLKEYEVRRPNLCVDEGDLLSLLKHSHS